MRIKNMAGLSIWHVLIFAIVVILLFGTSKLKNLGKDVGGAIKDFKKSVREEEEAEAAQLQYPRTIDAKVKASESSIKN
jgi:sec-independent protein translocase protein TatA